MLASVASATLLGVDGHVVTVEVHVSSGLPSFTIVGLPDMIVRESRERVRAALLSSGLEWPSRRITVNLAPGGIRKHGAGLDVAVALGILLASEALPAGSLSGTAMLGDRVVRKLERVATSGHTGKLAVALPTTWKAGGAVAFAQRPDQKIVGARVLAR